MLACAHLYRPGVREKCYLDETSNSLFDADGLDSDEASRVRRLEAAKLVHRGLLLIVETLWIMVFSLPARLP